MNTNRKVALVTGASRGIGRAIAKRLARDGALVLVHFGNNAEAAAETVRLIESAGGECFAVQADLAAGHPAISRMFENIDQSLAKLGYLPKIDILVNNAAIDRLSTLEDLDFQDFDAIFSTNVRGPLMVTKEAVSRMKSAGRIVNISSTLTRVIQTNELAYTMAKGALDRMTICLAKELGPRGITVNAIAPGVVDTDMVAGWLHSIPQANESVAAMAALGRVGQSDDIADLVSVLISNDSRWVTGQTIDASGGFRF